MAHLEIIDFLRNYIKKYPFTGIESKGFSIEYYKSGGGSHIFKLLSGGNVYAIRVNYYEKKNEWGVKETEFETLTYLGKREYTYAPRVYLFCRHDDEENLLGQDFIVVDFVEGEDFSGLQITDSDIKLLAGGLRTLHSLNSKVSGAPYVCGVFDEFANGEDKYIEKYSEADFVGIEEMYDQYNTYKRELGAWFNTLTIFSDVNEEVLCHADLKKENVLRTPEGICFIDWECAGDDIRETDIGRLFSGFQFSNKQKALFMREYFLDEIITPEIVSRISAVEVVLNFFRILDQYCIRQVVPWNEDFFKKEYMLWYETFSKVKDT
jgi:thiamine kinase-like enzyme